MQDLIPLSDEQAKAVQEAFKFGSQSLETARAFGGYAARILGTVPEDLVGLLGGDWLRCRRAENIAIMAQKAHERLEARQVRAAEPVSLSVALPLLQAAGDESREELVDLWARLLAAAMDPARTGRVRQTFIDAVKKMDPLDARVLSVLPAPVPGYQPNVQECLGSQLGVSSADVELSLLHLIDLNCLYDTQTRVGVPVRDINRVEFTLFGRELTRLLRD